MENIIKNILNKKISKGVVTDYKINTVDGISSIYASNPPVGAEDVKIEPIAKADFVVHSSWDIFKIGSGVVKFSNLSSDNYYYRIDKEKLEKLVEEEVTTNFEKYKEKIGGGHVDALVDIKLVNGELEISYNPVHSWEGDGLRNDDNVRTMTDGSVVKTFKTPLDLKVDRLADVWVDIARNNFELIGATETIEYIEFSVEEVAEIMEAYKKEKYEANLARAKKLESLLNEKFHIEDMYSYTLYDDIVGETELMKEVKKLLDNESFLIRNGMDVFRVVDKYSVTRGEDGVFVKAYKEKYSSITELPEEDIKEYDLSGSPLRRLKIRKGENAFISSLDVDEKLLSELTGFGYKVHRDIKINLGRGSSTTLVLIITDPNTVEVRNKSYLDNGKLIGKGGKTIKEIAKQVGMRFIKL